MSGADTKLPATLLSNNSNNGPPIQQKILNYARDYALEKLHKTLDKKRRRANDGNEHGDNDDEDAASVMSRKTPAHRRERRRRSAGVGAAQMQRQRQQHQYAEDDDDIDNDENASVVVVTRCLPPQQRRHFRQYETAPRRPSQLLQNSHRRHYGIIGATADHDSNDYYGYDYKDEYDDGVATELVRLNSEHQHSSHHQRQQRRHLLSQHPSSMSPRASNSFMGDDDMRHARRVSRNGSVGGGSKANSGW